MDRKRSWWLPVLAAAVIIAFSALAVRPVVAQARLGLPSENALREKAENLHSVVQQLIAELKGFSCVDMTAYKRLAAEVDRYDSRIFRVRAELSSYHRRAKHLYLGTDYDDEDENDFENDFESDTGFGHLRYELGRDEAALDDALDDLKICPPNTTYSAVPPGGPINPGGHVLVNPPGWFFPPLGGTLQTPPPSLTLDTEECKPCQNLAKQIEEIDQKIQQLERSQKSLRAAHNPQLDKAIRDDDAKIAALKQQKAALAEKLEKCRESCHPKQTSWTGGYGGGGLGVGWASGTWTTKELISLGLPDALVDAIKDMQATRLAADVYAGYYWGLSAPGWLAGLEADWTYYNARMDPGIPGSGGLPGSQGGDSVTLRAQWGASVRGHIGYLVTPATQVYATAGPAWLNERATVNCTATGVCGSNGIPAFSQTNTATKFGYTVGGGIETMLVGSWRGRAEYRYSDYGSFSTTFGTPANLALAAGIRVHTQTLLFGLSYAFGH